MLNFSQGKPIAIIKGGVYNNQIVHVGEKSEEKIESKGKDPYEYFEEDEIRNLAKAKGKKMTPLDFAKLKRSMLAGKEISGDEGLNQVRKNLAHRMPELERKTINIHDEGVVEKVPNPEESERIYICGPTGSGKSYQISKYVGQFKKMFKKSPIYLFSDQDSDEALDKHDVIRIALNESIIENPIQPDELAIKNKDETYLPSLVIFDDIDSITNKHISESVTNLRDTLLKRGRHFNVYTICTAHQCTNYKDSRVILNEVSSITVFPKSGSTNGIKRVLETYCGMNKKQVAEIFNLPSRWVTVNKNYPMYVLYEKGIYML